MEMNFQLRRERTIGFQGNIFLLGGEMLEQRLAVELHHVAHLGGKHIMRALRGSLPNELCSLLEAWLGEKAGAHLHHGGSEGEISGHGLAFSPASNESSLPSRSSA